MKKIVLNLEFHGKKSKQKAMKIAAGIPGVESVGMDKDQKLTVIGDIDPVMAVNKLRKLCRTEIVSVGPVKEPEKKPATTQYYPPPPPVPCCYTFVEEYPTGCIIC